MPETPSGRFRGSKFNAGRNKHKSTNNETREERETSAHSQDKSEDGTRQALKQAKQKQASRDNSDTEDEQKDNELTDPEDKLVACLLNCLSDCSRQRLRALHMTLRHYGNVDNRVTLKDFQTSLQSNQVKLSTRAIQIISELFEDAMGLDYERLYQCMSRAHLRTGRDSIKARNKRNDLASKLATPTEQMDQDFLRRLEEQIVRDQTYFDLDILRSEFYKWDHTGSGKMSKEGAYLICSEKTPLYGALLKNLINRCDENKDNKLSWPLLLNFMETAQTNAWEKYPELSSLPEKGRKKATVRIVTPEPIDELSSRTKSKVVNKLLKKNPDNSSSDQLTDVDTGEFKLLALHRQVVALASEEGAYTDAPTQNQFEKSNSLQESSQPAFQTGLTEKNVSSNEHRVNSGRSQIRTNHVLTSDKVLDIAAQNEANGCKKEKEKPTDGYTEKVGEDNRTAKDTLQTSDTAELTSGNTEKEAGTVPISQSDDTRNVPRAHENEKTKKEAIALEWIYGYRGHDCSSNLLLLMSGEIIYFIATIIVMNNIKQHKQRHYREHTDRVDSLAVHSDGLLVASGQCASAGNQGQKALVRVWRSDTLQTLHVLGKNGEFTESVLSLRFMPAANILACVDNCTDKNMTVWDTHVGGLLAQTSVSTDLVSDIEFNPRAPDILVTCGKEHLVWWIISAETGKIQMSARPNFDTFVKTRHFNCLCHNQRGEVVTGDTTGTIHIWGSKDADIITIVKNAHQGPILDLLHYGNHLLTAGKDRAISCWTMDKTMDKENTLQLPRSEGGVRRLLLLPVDVVRGNVLVIGTLKNSIIPLTLSKTRSPLTDIALADVPITQGHTKELRAITKIDKSFLDADIISASADGVVCKLNSQRQEAVWRLCMKGYHFLCVDTSLEGDLICLGTTDGKLLILTVAKEDLTVLEVLDKKISPGAVTCVKLSPDERMLAATGADKEVHLYLRQGKHSSEGTDNWLHSGTCKGHTSHVDSIEWSPSTVDGAYVIRTFAGYFLEEKLWNVSSCEELVQDKLADINWSLRSRELEHILQGLRLQQTDEDHVTCVDVHLGTKTVAMATSRGCLFVSKFSNISDGTWSTAHLTYQPTYNLCFTTNGRSLLTVGGPDVCIMQWKVI